MPAFVAASPRVTPLDLVAGMSVADLAAACRVDPGQCPACGATHRGARDRRPAVLVVGGTGWRCFTCDAQGGTLRWFKAWANGRPLRALAAEVLGVGAAPRQWRRVETKRERVAREAREAWADVVACADVWLLLDGAPDLPKALQVVLALRAHALGWDAWDAAGEYVAALDLPACMG